MASLLVNAYSKSSSDVSPESGIFPERFSSGSFKPAKVDVVHQLADGSGEPGRKDPGKNRIAWWLQSVSGAMIK